LVLLRDRDGDEEDAEDVVAVALELRSRLVVVLRRLHELLDRGRVKFLGRLRPQLLLAWIEEIDPPCRGHGLTLAGGSARPRSARPRAAARSTRRKGARAARSGSARRRARP